MNVWQPVPWQPLPWTFYLTTVGVPDTTELPIIMTNKRRRKKEKPLLARCKENESSGKLQLVYLFCSLYIIFTALDSFFIGLRPIWSSSAYGKALILSRSTSNVSNSVALFYTYLKVIRDEQYYKSTSNFAITSLDIKKLSCTKIHFSVFSHPDWLVAKCVLKDILTFPVVTGLEYWVSPILFIPWMF